ncbi:phosphatidylglycerophosphatase A [Pseudomaricurvus alkylphenolicus]|uniref:phosphatidylglycerophosphatase A family protein n=1 Tax=Pseudomaricurvus alkylphenolicus TaxID=1306991 RepID=UPI00141D915F|nr:phosphatidylglycerophosphatase A [Pseudomaricurvus alkylphenolicus]NIB39048.1 phosphatidylglycerophosphatase A [Pseudomaricurvus alkylphenolicus]
MNTSEVTRTSVNPSFQELLARPVHLLAFGFGSGLSPKAPGTVGTLAAVPLYLAIAQLPLSSYLLVLVLTFLAGVYICDRTARDLGVHDHGGIVWDEFVGYWIAMFAAPSGWLWPLLGFIWFRLFDIWKPWPISWADKRVGGGLGIMLDDVLAGLMALLAMQVCYGVLQ